jgi:hypothetical protein
MLTTVLLTVLLAEATPAERADPPSAKTPATQADAPGAKTPATKKPAAQADAPGAKLPSGTPAATTPATRDTPTVDQKETDNPVFPPLPEGTAGSQVLEPGRSPVEPDREALPKELSDVPLAPMGPAPPSSTPQTEKHSGKTGGGASRVDSIR